MKFDLDNVKTTVDITLGDIGSCEYGYFSNDIDSLKTAITKEKTSLRVIYARLESLLSESTDKRFSTLYGNFALFYPLEKTANVNRY